MKSHCDENRLSLINPKMKSPRESNQVIRVSTECSHHDLSIFPGMFNSGTMSHPCDSEQGPHLVAKSQCLHPAVEQGSAPDYRHTCDP
jgi:hypothetical protein